MLTKRAALTGAAALIACAITTGASATNGMYMPGYGPETTGRGGANLAISDRTLAVNFNPAGISQLQGNHLSVSVSLLAPTLEFENMLNHSRPPSQDGRSAAASGAIDGEDRYFPMPSIAYVRGGTESPWTLGIGLVAQGGMGATFRGQNTFFGTVDETDSEVRFATFTPTVAYALGEDMAIGATWNLGYADASFRFFPETSFFNYDNPEMSFFGLGMDKAKGFQTNLRVGWWWSADPTFSIGAIYQTKTKSTYENGDMMVNFTAHPMLGQEVSYDGEMDGFDFAAQAGVGIAIRPTEKWVLAADLKRYFWDDAIDTIEVKATNPSVPGAPPEILVPFVFDWKDQWVVALGADYRVNDKLTLRGGYNFGENPVPDETLNPLFPATVEHHVAGGLSYLTSGGTTYEFAVERAFNKSATNDNINPMINPFGPGARVDHSQWTVSLGVSWVWAR